jgi:amino acid transporter
MSTTLPTAGIGPVHLAAGRRLSLGALISVAFFTTCGGAFGLEGLIGAVGPGWAFVLLFLTPMLWSAPIALMVAELSSLIPEEGGYYIWVRDSLGSFWAVQEGWWTIGSSLMLMAIFPVVFTSYLGYLLPGVGAAIQVPGSGPVVRWLIALAVIGSAMAVNWSGAREVGRSSKIAITFVLGAFSALVLVWIVKGGSPGIPLGIIRSDLATEHHGALLLGLSIVILNYGGYDNIATYAGEVDRPRRNYPIALGAVIALAILSYAVPVLVGLAVTTDPAVWSADAGWPVIADRLGGRWLSGLLAAAGMVSMWACFNAQLLYTSRIPYVLARDGWLPRWLASAGATTAAPRGSLAGVCAIAAVFAALSFGSLVVLMSILYTAALALEFAALLTFRVRRPDAARPFRIPGGRWGLAYVCLPPLAVSAVVLETTLREREANGLLIAIIGGFLLSGMALYAIPRRRMAVSIDQELS